MITQADFHEAFLSLERQARKVLATRNASQLTDDEQRLRNALALLDRLRARVDEDRKVNA